MVAIQFKLRELVDQKSEREQRKITYRKIREETGINLNTITAMMNNEMKQVGLETIDRLTDWLPCRIGDLMVKTK